MYCSNLRLTSPGELLKARFIRPEDVTAYEEVGVDMIKIAGRGRETDWLLRAAGAYVARRWDGNFIDISDLGLWCGPGMDPPRVIVDNQALHGLLKAVAAVDCERECGVSCTICDRFAERAVRIENPGPYLQALGQARHESVVSDGKKLPEMIDRPGVWGRK
jgi:hypothetical protein